MTAAPAPRIYIHRLGCPKVEADLDSLAGLLRRKGAKLVDAAEKADVAVISTCAFILDSRAEAVDAILEAARWKEEKPGRRVYVTGCLPILHHAILVDEIPEVDGWFQFNQLEALIEAATSDKTVEPPQIIVPPGQVTPSFEVLSAENRGRVETQYAYLRIAEGCDRRCAYCAIPGMRGAYRSKPFDVVLTEARRLLDSGVRELILVAQEVNSYGKDLDGAVSIEALLDRLDKLLEQAEGKRWLRILYTHPPIFSEEFVQALGRTTHLVPYLDFPIEHADDSVLRAMRRGVTWKKMRRWIDRLRETIPDIALRTSIIVGHPGERAREFDTLLARLEEVKFERLGVFSFSREDNTHAGGLAAVDGDEAFRREAQVQLMAEEQAEAWYETKIGAQTELLVEHVKNGHVYGRTPWDAPDIDGDAIARIKAKPGDILTGTITEVAPYRFTLRVE